MKETFESKVVVGQPLCQVKFNFGVVGATGAGKRTFTKALTEPYDLIGFDYQINVMTEEELAVEALKNKHSNWIDECKIPTTDEVSVPLNRSHSTIQPSNYCPYSRFATKTTRESIAFSTCLSHIRYSLKTRKESSTFKAWLPSYLCWPKRTR